MIEYLRTNARLRRGGEELAEALDQTTRHLQEAVASNQRMADRLREAEVVNHRVHAALVERIKEHRATTVELGATRVQFDQLRDDHEKLISWMTEQVDGVPQEWTP